MVFLVSAAGSLFYVYQRPAIYQSTASLLVTPPADSSALRASLPADSQSVGFERHAMMTNSLMEMLRERLNRELLPEDITRWSVPELQRILRVERFEETNIVRLWARGADPAELPLMINVWIDLYLELQQEFQQSLYNERDEELARQAAEMQVRVELKRLQQANFRETNDIVSLQREENRVVSRLRGLTNSLDRAEEEVVKAEADLDAAIRSAASGDVVADREDKLQISQLEDEVAVRRKKLVEFRQRYTDAFVALDRDIQLVMEELEIYEEQLEQRRRRAADRFIGEARRTVASAEQAAADLQAQLDESELELAAFTAIFAENEALEEELGNLEEAYREITKEQVRRQVDRDRAVTRVEVLERANEPTEPSWPNYTRDAAIAVGGSALLGFIVVLLFDFFTRPTVQPAGVPMEAITIGTVSTPTIMHEEAEFIEDSQPQRQLADRASRPKVDELSVEDVHKLLRAAEPKTRALIALLLSGVGGPEVLAIRGKDLNLEEGTVRLSGLSKRRMPLSDAVCRSLTRADFRCSREEQTILRHQNEEPYSLSELDGMIARAADDAEIGQAGGVDSALLRQSYLAFLARQGADLTEFQDIIGRVPPGLRTGFVDLMPPGGPRPFESITLEYPGLDELA